MDIAFAPYCNTDIPHRSATAAADRVRDIYFVERSRHNGPIETRHSRRDSETRECVEGAIYVFALVRSRDLNAQPGLTFWHNRKPKPDDHDTELE